MRNVEWLGNKMIVIRKIAIKNYIETSYYQTKSFLSNQNAKQFNYNHNDRNNLFPVNFKTNVEC